MFFGRLRVWSSYLKIAPLSELLAAALENAAECLFGFGFGVCLFVGFQVAALGEAFSTLVAAEGLYPCVSLFMGLNSIRPG